MGHVWKCKLTIRKHLFAKLAKIGKTRKSHGAQSHLAEVVVCWPLPLRT